LSVWCQAFGRAPAHNSGLQLLFFSSTFNAIQNQEFDVIQNRNFDLNQNQLGLEGAFSFARPRFDVNQTHETFYAKVDAHESAAHRDTSREWDVATQKWNLC
jgi:hypothetical protein